MKIRNGFVSNSSSASFCINSNLLTEGQKDILLIIGEHEKDKQPSNDESIKYYKTYEEMQFCDGWMIKEDKKKEMIIGFTVMDNGCLEEFFEKINIDKNLVFWEDHN